MRLGAIITLTALLLGQPALAGHTVPPNRPGAYAPRDTCVKTPAARSFVARLRSAVARRDVRALVDLAAGDVQLDFGGGSGKVLLRSQLTGKDGPALWHEFEEVLSLGCAMDRGDMAFPWLYAQELGDVDPFEALVATGPAVPIYARANTRSAPIGRLNWQMVIVQEGNLGPEADKRPMRRVSVINSPLEGYVPSDKLRSVIDRRLIVTRHGSVWEISAFVAGD